MNMKLAIASTIATCLMVTPMHGMAVGLEVDVNEIAPVLNSSIIIEGKRQIRKRGRGTNSSPG